VVNNRERTVYRVGFVFEFNLALDEKLNPHSKLENSLSNISRDNYFRSSNPK
jgi:hypothetical protein